MVELAKMAEIQEAKVSETAGFREIKPESDIKSSDAKQFWDGQFDNSNTNEAGQKEYYDDNGEKYRTGNQLEPNKKFEVNGYTFETDDKGRTISAEGQLRMRSPEFKRDMDSMDAVGKGDQKNGDQRGHLIGHQFEGSGGIENLVPMEGKLNQGDYVKLETTLADAVKDGADVKLKVEPVYEGDSNRPSEFRVSYSIDGDKNVVTFRNGNGD